MRGLDSEPQRRARDFASPEPARFDRRAAGLHALRLGFLLAAASVAWAGAPPNEADLAVSPSVVEGTDLVGTASPFGAAGLEGTASLEAAVAPLDAADAAWFARATELDADGLRAKPEGIAEAIVAYRRAIQEAPDGLEARWKLMRALHYSIDFASLEDDAREANAEEAVEVARESLALLERKPGSDADRARVYFWSSIAWALRADRVGLLTIVREGVADRIRDQAERSLALDPSVDRGGALRLLARLHSTLPKVPFISGWVDRERGLAYAERAMEFEPFHPGNPLLQALTILEVAPEREAEARAALAIAAASTPREAFLIEDRRIRRDARERLAELDREGGTKP